MAVQTKLFEGEYAADTIELYRDMTEAYIGYARETITDRALPDVRDGLKPVQRRILYAMYDLGLTHNKPHKKSARIVGEVLGKYHPHGDSSVYLAMVRMAQEFVMEAPLVDGQGNFGSIDGDSPAAMRYTEARLTALAEMMLQDLHMDTVSWIDNFDGSLQEPTVLPTIVPNLLVNGSDGIAVGMATKIPPHNLGEVCDAVVYVANNWSRRRKIDVDDLLPIIPGPDFPTGGLIYRYREDEKGESFDVIRQAYSEGRGRVVMQARLMLEDIGGGKTNIIITELPYAVLKTTVIEKLAREIREGRITGITDLRDESDYTGMRVVIEVSRTANPQDVLQDILKYSQLRETFGIINLALVPTDKQQTSKTTNIAAESRTRPEYLSLARILNHFVEHRLTVIEQRSRFELERRKARLHIVEGLLKAMDVLDEVIALIRSSRTADTARTNLIRTFGFSELQATAILDMQLRRLAALERRRLVDEKKELLSRIHYLETLLASEKKRLAVVIEETAKLKEEYAIPRRTVIIDQEGATAGRGTVTTQADLVLPDEPQIVIQTPTSLERRSASGFSYQVSDGLSSRTPVGGGQLAHLKTQATDEVVLITNKGRVWKGGVGFIPESATFAELGLAPNERVINAAVLQSGFYLILGTREGKVKRTKTDDLSMIDRTWTEAIGLTKGDDILFGDVAGEGAHIVFYTKQGQFLRIEGDTVNSQQTPSAAGVVGAKTRTGDTLLGGAVVPNAAKDEEAWHVVIVSEYGYTHRVSLSAFPVKGRGTLGVRCLAVTKGTGNVGGVAFGQGNKVDAYLDDGRRQRLSLDSIPSSTTRDARGRRLIADPKKRPVVTVVMLS